MDVIVVDVFDLYQTLTLTLTPEPDPRHTTPSRMGSAYVPLGNVFVGISQIDAAGDDFDNNTFWTR